MPRANSAGAAAFFEDTLRYLYMPRFKNRDVLAQAIRSGAASRDFFGTAYGQSGNNFDGCQLGAGNVIFDDTLLLIEPTAAAAYEAAHEAVYNCLVAARPAQRLDGTMQEGFPVGALTAQRAPDPS